MTLEDLDSAQGRLQNLLELMGWPTTQWQVAAGDSNMFGREISSKSPPGQSFRPIRKPVRTEQEPEKKGASPFAGSKKAGAKSLAKAKTKKRTKPPEDAEPQPEEPEDPAAEPKDAPAEKPAEKPAGKSAEKKPKEEPKEEPPEEPEEKPKEEPVKIWKIPMDTILGRTATDDLERYLKTLAATLQNKGLDLEKAAEIVDAVVAQMTQVKLLPPLPGEPSDDEISTWMNAALSANLASIVIDRV